MKFFRKTKIVSTIGPASSSEKMISELIQKGVNVFRLNFSHGTHKDHKKSIELIRKTASEIGIEVAILQDLQGPKIRIGKILGKGFELKKGDEVVITTNQIEGKNNKVSTTYKKLPKDVHSGDRLLLDDGLIELQVLSSKSTSIVCVVKVGGLLTSNKGINLPGVALTTPALTKKDEEDLKFGLQNDIDFVALSFVRTPKDLNIIYKKMKEYGRVLPVISKIEKPTALEYIDEIIEKSYGIMVARGDLGVEINPEEVPSYQKEICKKCNRVAKPVIIATQMLDSMIRNPRPTRAEASDVANAVLDGADALMLSGETAAGKYPKQSVAMMAKIIDSTEKAMFSRGAKIVRASDHKIESISQNICHATVSIASKVKANLIACITYTGVTALELSKFKSSLPVIAFTYESSVVRILRLTWGVYTIKIPQVEGTTESFQAVDKFLLEKKIASKGDTVVFTSGMPNLGEQITNMLKIHTL